MDVTYREEWPTSKMLIIHTKLAYISLVPRFPDLFNNLETNLEKLGMGLRGDVASYPGPSPLFPLLWPGYEARGRLTSVCVQ